MGAPSSFVPDNGAVPSSFQPDDAGPSGLDSFGRGVAQGGTLGFADEIAGGAEALYDQLKGSDSPFADAYRKHRDESRANFQAAEDADPTLFTAGKIGGNVLTGLVAAPLTGGGSLAGAIASGAGMGAVNALGESNELDQQAAGDALTQGLTGGALGAAGHGLGALAGKGINALTQKVAPKLAPLAEDVAVSAANRAVRGGATGGADLTRPQLLRALEEGHINHGDTVGDIAKSLGGARQQAGEYTQALRGALGEEGARPDVGALAKELLAEADKFDKVDPAVASLYRDKADLLLKNGTEAFEGEFPAGDWVRRGSLEDANTLRQAVAGSANWKDAGAKALNEAKKDIAGRINTMAGDEIAKVGAAGGEEAQTLAGSYAPAMKRNSDLIALSNAANKGVKMTNNRGGVGPTAKLAGLASVATGHPMGLVAAGAKHLYDTRGQSTLAKLAFDVSKSLGKVGGLAVANPAKLGRWGSVLASAAARGQDALNSTHFVLGQTDPAYQEMVANLEDGDAR